MGVRVRKTFLFILLMTGAVGFLTSCPGSGNTSEAGIEKFNADNLNLAKPGERVELSWKAVNTNYCYLTGTDASGTKRIDAQQPCEGSITDTPTLKTNYQFSARKADGGFVSKTILVTIGGDENSRPVATPQNVSITPGNSVNITLAGTDADAGTTLTFKIISPPSKGTLSPLSGAKVTYTAPSNFSGTDSFTFVANDGKIDSEPATVTLNNSTQPFWEPLGGALDRLVSRESFFPTVVLDSAGNPIVAWQETINATDKDIYVSKWDGSNWQPLGDWLDTTGPILGFNPAMTIYNNNPLVSWLEDNGSVKNIRVAGWNGSAWQPYGSVNVSSDGSQPTASFIDVTSSGSPVVVLQDLTSDSRDAFFVKYWDGSWIEYDDSTGNDGSVNRAGNAFNAQLLLDGSDTPIVVWAEEGSTSNDLYVKKYNGNWDVALNSLGDAGLYGTESLPNPRNANPSMALDSSGNPVVAWDVKRLDNTESVYIKRWDGDSWEAYGGSAFFENGSDPALVLDSSNRPIIAWSQNLNVYVKRWNGSTWEPLGTGPLDNNPGENADEPSIALDNQGNPIVTWQENENIYVKRYVP